MGWLPLSGWWPAARWSLSGQDTGLSFPVFTVALWQAPSESQLSLGPTVRTWEGSFSISGEAAEGTACPLVRSSVGSFSAVAGRGQLCPECCGLWNRAVGMRLLGGRSTELFLSLTWWKFLLSVCMFPFHWPSLPPSISIGVSRGLFIHTHC